MTASAYRIYSTFLILLVTAFPLFQLFSGAGLLFYTNGWDEASYLQYDYAKHVLEVSGSGRLAQWLVVLLHDIGLSGGEINLLFDLSMSAVFLYFLPRVLVLLGTSHEFAREAVVCLMGLPLILSNLNPLFDLLQTENMQRTSIQFLTMPYIKDPFWLRTPEPQLSLALLLVCSYFFISLRNSVLLLPVLLFAYPFVAIPLGFLILSHFLIKVFNCRLSRALVISALLVTALLNIYYEHFMPPLIEGYIIKTRLPLITFCGILACVAYWGSKLRSELMISLLCSIWLAVNFQLVSKFTIQPNNFEQYWSSPICIFIFLLALEKKPYFKILPSISCILLLLWGISDFKKNYSLMSKIELAPDLLAQIRNDASLAAVDDITLSTKLDMLYPKQKPLLFSYTRFYKKLPELFLYDLLCANIALKGTECEDTAIKASEHFMGGDQNYIMNTIGRVEHRMPLIDLNADPGVCEMDFTCWKVN